MASELPALIIFVDSYYHIDVVADDHDARLGQNTGNERILAGKTISKFFFGHGRIVHLGTGRFFVVFDDESQLG